MKNVTIYVTTKAVRNPQGDGRHNRANWRSPLDKTEIPAGFVFALDDEGNIEDRSVPVATLSAKKGAALRAELLKVASAPLGTESDIITEPETVADVLEGADSGAVAQVMEALNLTPAELRRLLSGQTKAQPSVTQRASAGQASR